MNKIILLLLCLGASLIGYSQKKAWKEMDSFHTIMSKTFHPAENGDLKPTLENIDELIKRAKTWQASEVPSGYNKKLIRPILDRLVTQTESIKTAIAEHKSDEDLQGMISRAHDTFHEIMLKCKK